MPKTKDFVSEDLSKVVENGGTIAEAVGIDVKYSKNQFLKSEHYKRHKDLIAVLLDDNKFYCKKEVEKAIESYLKRSVM